MGEESGEQLWCRRESISSTLQNLDIYIYTYKKNWNKQTIPQPTSNANNHQQCPPTPSSSSSFIIMGSWRLVLGLCKKNIYKNYIYI
jgi:hypothetical protein